MEKVYEDVRYLAAPDDGGDDEERRRSRMRITKMAADVGTS